MTSGYPNETFPPHPGGIPLPIVIDTPQQDDTIAGVVEVVAAMRPGRPSAVNLPSRRPLGVSLVSIYLLSSLDQGSYDPCTRCFREASRIGYPEP